MKKIFFTLLLLMAGLVLSGCGSSPKDYSNATPLSTIKERVKVKALWATPTADVPDFAHAQLPVVVDGAAIYVAGRAGSVEAIDKKTGAALWKISLGEILTGGPGVNDDTLFVGTGEAELVALDKKTGKERWRHRVSSEMLAQPVIAGETLLVQTTDDKISAYKTASGDKLWSYSRILPKLTLRGTSTPIVIGDKVLAGFSDGHIASLSLATGELLWEATVAVPHGRTDLERMVDIDGLFAATDGVVYVSSYQGRVAALSVADGNVLWAREMSSYVGLAVADQHIFVTSEEGKVWALDGRTGATLWRQDNLAGREVSAPAILGNTVVVADYAGYVHFLSREDGGFVARQDLNKVWSTLQYIWEDEEQPEASLRSVSVAPVVVAGTLYVRDNRGALAAFTLAN